MKNETAKSEKEEKEKNETTKNETVKNETKKEIKENPTANKTNTTNNPETK